MRSDDLHGIIASFETQEQLLAAARAARDAGFSPLDAYAPHPVEELTEALGHRRSRLPYFMFLGGLFGGVGGYFMQWYASVVDYPIDIGGRPLHSWPAFIPPTFELTVLGAAVTGFFGVFIASRLPKPYHPVFNLAEFSRASQDRYFLCIEAAGADFQPENARRFLESQQALTVTAVPK